MTIELPFTQLPQEIRQGNFYWADHVTLAAQGCRLREVEGILEASIRRGKH
jgi:hypothetical protein